VVETQLGRPLELDSRTSVHLDVNCRSDRTVRRQKKLALEIRAHDANESHFVSNAHDSREITT